MVFGEAMDLSRFDATSDEPETWRAIADAVRDTFVALGETERAFRAREGLLALGPTR